MTSSPTISMSLLKIAWKKLLPGQRSRNAQLWGLVLLFNLFIWFPDLFVNPEGMEANSKFFFKERKAVLSPNPRKLLVSHSDKTTLGVPDIRVLCT